MTPYYTVLDRILDVTVRPCSKQRWHTSICSAQAAWCNGVLPCWKQLILQCKAEQDQYGS